MAQPPWDAIIEGVVVDFEGNHKGSDFKIRWQTIGANETSSNETTLTGVNGKFKVIIPRYLYLIPPYLFSAFEPDDKLIGQAILDIPVAGVDGNEKYQIIIVEGALIEIIKGQLKSNLKNAGKEYWLCGNQDVSLDKKTSVKSNGIMSLLKEIKDSIQNRLEYDAVKEKAFDKLYEEMRRQKEASGLLDRTVKPILSDLLLLYDSMRKFELSLINNQSTDNGETCQNFGYLIEELLEILYRQEVIPMDESLSAVFNSKRHKATKTENAESKDDDFKIVSIVRNGFTWRDKVLRPQEVVIKRFINKA